MSVWKYRRLTPKVLVSKLRLIDPNDTIDLVNKDLGHVYLLLGKTAYQQEISEIAPQGVSSISLEDAVLRNFIRTVDEIARYSPKNVREFLATTLKKFEASNVKTILRSKSAGVGVDDALRNVIPAGKLDHATCKEILEKSQSVRDVVKHLSHTTYGPVLEQVLEEYEKTKLLLPLEVAVDRCVYGQIWKAVVKLKGLDGRIARTVLGLEVDSINIRTILRCKQMGLSQDQMTRFLIPVSDVLRKKELEEAAKATDTRAILDCLLAAARLNLARDYQHLLIELTKDYESRRSIPHLEMVLDRGLIRTSLRMLKRYTPFFNIGLVLAFLNLKWFELRNLRTIIAGVERGMPPSKVRELLILPT
jgi:V/A-type H+-transporting ATPase subunit C